MRMEKRTDINNNDTHNGSTFVGSIGPVSAVLVVEVTALYSEVHVGTVAWTVGGHILCPRFEVLELEEQQPVTDKQTGTDGRMERQTD